MKNEHILHKCKWAPAFYSSLSGTTKLSAEIQVLFGKMNEFFHLLLPKLEIQIIKIIEDLTG